MAILDDTEIDRIVSDSGTYCDPGLSLHLVLTLLVEANMQQADEDSDSEEMKNVKAQAETSLFKLATRLTNGERTR